MGSVISLQTSTLFSEEGARVAVYDVRPLGSLGDSVDIADNSVYLDSDEDVWITGTPLVVDSGVTSSI